jgi:hypothetical protein
LAVSDVSPSSRAANSSAKQTWNLGSYLHAPGLVVRNRSNVILHEKVYCL